MLPLIVYVLLANLENVAMQDTLRGMPQQQKLLAYWPLGNKTTTRDVGPNNFRPHSGAPVVNPPTSLGPFGDRGTSMTCEREFCYVENDARFSFTYSSFTIAFFVYPDRKPQGALFRTDRKNGLGMYFEDGTRLILIGKDKRQIMAHRMLQPDIWNFIAITFDYSGSRLSVYGKHGLVYQKMPCPDIYMAIGNNERNDWGIARVLTPNQQDLYTLKTQEFACVSVHKTELTEDEIGRLVDTCRHAQGSPPSGQPRLFELSSLPRNSEEQTNPGRMPWMVSVRGANENGHKCTASIFSEYFLITSAGCAKQASSVIVGEHDTSITEPFEATHSVKKIYYYPNSEYDIAIIQLDRPISMENLHVNNLALRRNEAIIASDLYHGGWSSDERIPRYSVGKLLPQTTCANVWSQLNPGDQYPAEKYMCVKSVVNKGVPCKNGDEGGALLGSVPLTTSDDNHLVMFGVFAMRDKCSESAPAFYTNILPALGWIKSTVACVVPDADIYPEKCPFATSESVKKRIP